MSGADRWVVCFEPRPSAAVRLLCLHHAGAGASSFRAWGRELPGWIEVAAIQLPGREGRLREPPPRSIRELAREIAAALGDAHDRPLAVFGHSMGALLGYELARVLSARGAEPAHLFLAGFGAPDRFAGGTRLDEMSTAQVVEHLRATDAAPRGVLDNDELLTWFVPIIQADIAMIAAHVHDPDAPPLRAAISAFGGRRDPEVPVAALRGWSELTTGDFRLRMLDGGHHFPSSAREALLRAIERDLADRFAPLAVAGAQALAT